MNAKKTIKRLEDTIFHTEQNLRFWRNEWDTTVRPANWALGKIKDHGKFMAESDIVDARMREINAYLDRIVNQHESACAQLRKIQRMSKIERLWIA